MSHISYCGHCGLPLTKQDDTHHICANGHIVYNNPRGAVCALILNENRTEVLLGVRGVEPRKGYLDPIGGFMDYGEDALECVTREVQEETGLSVDVLGIIGAYTSLYLPDLTTTSVTYVCSITGGNMKAADDVAEVKWIDIQNPPQPDECAWEFMPRMFVDLQKWVAKQQVR